MNLLNKKDYKLYSNFLNTLAKDLNKFYFSKLKHHSFGAVLKFQDNFSSYSFFFINLNNICLFTILAQMQKIQIKYFQFLVL